MKTVILATLAFLSLSTQAVVMPYQPGKVVATSCGKNDYIPTVMTSRLGYIDTICAVTIQGIRQSTPMYTISFVSGLGKTSTYVYSQVALRPVYSTSSTPSVTGIVAGINAVMDLQIIGFVDNGKFGAINFIRAPDLAQIYVGLDKYRTVTNLVGTIKGFTESHTYQVLVKKMNTIYYIQ